MWQADTSPYKLNPRFNGGIGPKLPIDQPSTSARRPRQSDWVNGSRPLKKVSRRPECEGNAQTKTPNRDGETSPGPPA